MAPLFTKIKGTLLVGIVRLIKSNKDKNLEAHFTEADRRLLEERIAFSTWYPGVTGRHLIQVIYELIAKKNPEVARQWGRFSALMIVPIAYKTFTEMDTFETLKSFREIFPSFVDSPWYKVTVEIPGRIEAQYLDPGNEPAFIPFAYMMGGWIEGLVELSKGKFTEYSITKEKREGRDAIIYRGSYTKA
jgi:hypothetical protein